MSSKTLYQIFLFSILSIFAVSSKADGLFGEIGLHLGGDKIRDVGFIGGGSDSIRAGELLSIAGGVVMDVNEQLEARISAGLKFDLVTADNGDLDFTRIPLELLFFKKNEQWNVGGGVTYHLNPELTGTGAASGAGEDYDDAFGFVLEADYILSTGAYLGIKLTFIEYETVDLGLGTTTYDGDSVGLVIGIKF